MIRRLRNKSIITTTLILVLYICFREELLLKRMSISISWNFYRWLAKYIRSRLYYISNITVIRSKNILVSNGNNKRLWPLHFNFISKRILLSRKNLMKQRWKKRSIDFIFGLSIICNKIGKECTMISMRLVR